MGDPDATPGLAGVADRRHLSADPAGVEPEVQEAGPLDAGLGHAIGQGDMRGQRLRDGERGGTQERGELHRRVAGVVTVLGPCRTLDRDRRQAVA